MVTIKSKGSFDKSIKFLNFFYKRSFIKDLNVYAQQGVVALASATPVDTGKTRDSWDYEIRTTPNKVCIYWTNSNMAGNIPVAILIQYGHATRDGYYIQGEDYINPAIRPVFDRIAEEIWKEVTNA